MWWLFLLLLLAVPLVPLVWAMLRVSKLRFADARGEVVAPEQVPERELMQLKDQVEPLVGSGFEYLGMRREIRGDGDFWQAFLHSAGGMVWAVAEESDDEEGGRRVSLLSFGSDGSVAITRDGDEAFGEEEAGVILRRDSFGSALEQAENHAALITEERVPVVALEPEVFLGRYERMASQGLDSFFEKGWLSEGRGKALKIPPAKLPQMALAWLKHELKTRARGKAGSSWLLAQNLGGGMVAAANVSSQPASDEVVSEEAGTEPIPEEAIEAIPVVGEVMPDVNEVDEAVAEALAANERAMRTPQVEAMPVGAIDEVADAAVEEEVLESVAEEKVVEEPAIEIPEEDGLPRDWALYQQQASKKSWAYWLGGFGGRAFLFLSLLVFSVWMAMSAGWGLRVVLFGVIALLVHEAGHAVVMLARRSWDWSHFIVPIPRAMSAKQWSIKGGWLELATVLAGPLPGLAIGWAILAKSFFGAPTSDLFLDFALAAVVVNSVTLLPFLPLDGGRLLDLAFLRRMPQLRTVGLVLAGFVFLALAFVGGGVVAGVLALLMWAGIPSARRRSKLLPWLRSNAKEDGEQQVVTAFNISRERSQRKSFKGAAGIARLDELMGLGQAKKLGFLGGLVALAVMGLSLSAPLLLPATSIASNGQEWFQEQKKVEEQAQQYLGELRPVKARKALDPKKQAEIEADAIADLNSWQERLAKNLAQPETVFSEVVDLNAVRTMKWRRAAHWIAESPRDRHLVAREAARAMRLEAIRAADTGDKMQAFRDLSTALLIVIECEPRHSLEAWVAWLELEREVLKEVEDVSSRYQLDDTYVKWYENALAQCPRPTSRKVAGLILAESQGFDSLLQGLDVKSLLPKDAEGGPGRRFLTSLRGVGDLVSVEALEERLQLAENFAESSSVNAGADRLKSAGKLPLEIEESLQRIENNYSFRQIAMSALKVKRVGMSGATQELAKLRKDYGYTARLDETNDRKALKLSRLTPTGEVVEMEWLLKQ